MNLKAIFGPVFLSVIAALVLYDLIIKGLVGKFMPKNTYDNTFDPTGDRIDANRAAIERRIESENRLRKLAA